MLLIIPLQCHVMMVKATYHQTNEPSSLLIVVPLLLYFSMVWYFFPAFYSSQSDRSQGLPIITQAGFDVSSASSGNPLSFSITTFNQGRPNLSGDISKEEIDPSRGYVKVKDYNFTQSPLFVASGDTVGKEYWGAETTTAKYPSIEYFSRPWKPRLDTVQLLKFLLTPMADSSYW